MKACFVVCWFGKLPDYLPVWLKTCKFNKEFDFLVLTDDMTYESSENVYFIHFDQKEFIRRAIERIGGKINFTHAYRLCDYRPMFGLIFKEELVKYDYWGYCDTDLVFGSISDFCSYEVLNKYEAIFNGGHFTLIRNCPTMNNLFKRKGAIFSYRIVTSHDAIFAFDETTGIQLIAKAAGINALYEIPYIEADAKYTQITSRFEKNNPSYQAYYWEKGHLYRVKIDKGDSYYQEVSYIHLQKRKIEILDSAVTQIDSFWIKPQGFASKTYTGKPTEVDIKSTNPFLGVRNMQLEKKTYRKRKIRELLRRNPFQIYVRLVQGFAGINYKDGMEGEGKWKSF